MQFHAAAYWMTRDASHARRLTEEWCQGKGPHANWSLAYRALPLHASSGGGTVQASGDRLVDALARVHPAYRLAVILRDIQDRTYDEIGALLGISTETVRAQIHEGRKAMREALRG